jgi:RNA-binding protein with serine-rich domain 1
MSTRGRSASPQSPPQSRDVDVDMDKQSEDKLDAKVIVITNLTRNVVEAHLQSVFGFYGEVVKIDLPIYVKCAYPHAPLSPFPFHLGTVVSASLF